MAATPDRCLHLPVGSTYDHEPVHPWRRLFAISHGEDELRPYPTVCENCRPTIQVSGPVEESAA